MILPQNPILPDIAERIRGYMNEIQQDWGNHPTEVARIAERAGAIPLVLDAGGFYALRPDGTVVEISWDTPESAVAIHSARLRDIALKGGSERYPALLKLLPQRPSDSMPCPQCGGSGTHPMAVAAGIENLVCWCGGFGWIPHDWEEASP